MAVSTWTRQDSRNTSQRGDVLSGRHNFIAAAGKRLRLNARLARKADDEGVVGLKMWEWLQRRKFCSGSRNWQAIRGRSG
jgi:hypothetical protein